MAARLETWLAAGSGGDTLDADALLGTLGLTAERLGRDFTTWLRAGHPEAGR